MEKAGAYGEELAVEEEEVEAERERDGAEQPLVRPGRHAHQRLVLAQAVQRVAHLDEHEHRERQRRRLLALEDAAVELVELALLRQALRVVRLRAQAPSKHSYTHADIYTTYVLY